MSEPLFSLVVPVYNSQDYLKECLDSILTQGASDLEVIALDDGSTDLSASILDEAALADARLKVVHGANKGPRLCREKGARLAKGEYVLFVDSDDVLRQDALSELAKVIVEKAPDVVCFDMSRKSDFSDRVLGKNFFDMSVTDADAAMVFRERVCAGRLNNMCNKAFKRTLFDAVEECPPTEANVKQGEDLLQLLPLVDVAKTFGWLNRSIYYYRPSPQSNSRVFKDAQIKDLACMFTSLQSYAEKWHGRCASFAEEAKKLHVFWLLQVISDSEIERDRKVLSALAVRDQLLTLISSNAHDGIHSRLDIVLTLTLLRHRAPLAALRVAGASARLARQMR